jgi:synaptotagmin-like protein
MSLRTMDFDSKIQIKGTISLRLSYNRKTSNLNIYIECCRDLAIANLKKKSSDPYVKFYLLPNKNKSDKRKTSIQRHTCNPIYNEELRVIIYSFIHTYHLFFYSTLCQLIN